MRIDRLLLLDDAGAHSGTLAHAHSSPALSALPTPVSALMRPTDAPPTLLPPLPPSIYLALDHHEPRSDGALLKLADTALQHASGAPDARMTFSKMVELSSSTIPPPQYQKQTVECVSSTKPEAATAGSAEKKKCRLRRSGSDESFSLSPKQSCSKDTSSITTNVARNANDSQDSSRKYPCPYYGEPKVVKRLKSSFDSPRSFLLNHIDDNTDKEILCFATFRRRQEMERHVLSVHCTDEEKAWKCPGSCRGRPCEKRYARADALRKHLDSAKSRNVLGGCSFGLSNAEIVAMVKRGCSLSRNAE
ncbi:hypothetical protein HDU83_001856 [Entophlyctis luteolus]|nr:hypothetical protein HDU83_001856 [Entophlyctis luteolus]